ncbi:MAG: amidohydrolase family protein, partial [Pseudomonadota bacterium]
MTHAETGPIAPVAVPEALLRAPEAFGGRSEMGCRIGLLSCVDGRPAGLAATEAAPRYVLLPPLTEPHVHLDKCHTVARCDSVGGDLAAAVAAQMRDKARWTREDLQHRMTQGLSELIRAGCGTIRTHIDWARKGAPVAWDVALALRAEAQSQGVTLQMAALTGIDEMADMAVAEDIAQRMAREDGVLGAFVLDHAGKEQGIRNLFQLADRYGLALDFHVDEGLAPGLNGLDLIVKVAREMRHEGPVLCGHACHLATRSADDVARIAHGLAEAGIAVATLPTTNLYLQGRTAGTPKTRGLTMVHELQARGVDLVVGTDNVRDAFCPIGVHDPLYTLGVAVLAGHLDPPLGRHLPMITTSARHALGLAPQWIDETDTEDLMLFEVP